MAYCRPKVDDPTERARFARVAIRLKERHSTSNAAYGGFDTLIAKNAKTRSVTVESDLNPGTQVNLGSAKLARPS